MRTTGCFIAVGDRGNGVSSDDPQNLGIPQGKILRIDPLGTNGAGGHYGIPSTNPFVGRPGALAEIYAYGLRDPYRFSWDPGGGNRMLLGNMGEHVIESIYEVRTGDNFGWGEREGPFVFRREDRCHVYPLPGEERLATVHEFLLRDGTGQQVSMPELAGDLGSICDSAAAAMASSTSCPRRTGRSGR